MDRQENMTHRSKKRMFDSQADEENTYHSPLLLIHGHVRTHILGVIIIQE
jgi:hypothetical protein